LAEDAAADERNRSARDTNLSDICNSDISDVILEMCPTKILLPNGEAKNPHRRSSTIVLV